MLISTVISTQSFLEWTIHTNPTTSLRNCLNGPTDCSQSSSMMCRISSPWPGPLNGNFPAHKAYTNWNAATTHSENRVWPWTYTSNQENSPDKQVEGVHFEMSCEEEVLSATALEFPIAQAPPFPPPVPHRYRKFLALYTPPCPPPSPTLSVHEDWSRVPLWSAFTSKYISALRISLHTSLGYKSSGKV